MIDFRCSYFLFHSFKSAAVRCQHYDVIFSSKLVDTAVEIDMVDSAGMAKGSYDPVRRTKSYLAAW